MNRSPKKISLPKSSRRFDISRSHSLGKRSRTLVLIIGLLYTLLTTFLHFTFDYRERMASLESRAAIAVDSLLPALSDSMWDLNQSMASNLLTGLSSFQYFRYLSLHSFEKTLEERGLMDSTMNLVEIPLVRKRASGETTVGLLRYQLDVNRIRSEVFMSTLVSAGVQAILIIVMALIVYFLFERLSTRHLRSIAGHIKSFDVVASPELVLGKKHVQDEIDILTDSFNHLHQELKSSLKQKDVLIEEVYHRTKNNMQVIGALMELQGMSIKDSDARQVFRDMSGRIRAMALAHEQMYQSEDLEHVTLAVYLGQLFETLGSTYGHRAGSFSTKLDMAPDIELPLEHLIPIGLVLNELIINSFKHGKNQEGAVHIELRVFRKENLDISLCFRDAGQGFAPGFDWRTSTGLGMRIISTLVEQQLKGSLSIITQDGLVCTMDLPLQGTPGAATTGLPR